MCFFFFNDFGVSWFRSFLGYFFVFNGQKKKIEMGQVRCLRGFQTNMKIFEGGPGCTFFVLVPLLVVHVKRPPHPKPTRN